MKFTPFHILLSIALPILAIPICAGAEEAPKAALAAPTVGAPPIGVPAGKPGEDSHAGHDHSAMDEGPKDESVVDYLWRKSDKAFHDGDYERAIGLHKAIVALEPDDVESYSVAAWLIWSLGRGDEAIEWLRKGIASNPRNPAMWDAAGQNFDLQKKFAESRDAYGHALEVAPKEADTMMVRRRFAHATEKAGDVAASQKIWEELVRDFPNDAVNKNNLQRVQGLAASKQ